MEVPALRIGKIGGYMTLRPARFSFLERLTIEKSFSETRSATSIIDVVLVGQAGQTAEKLHITFSDAVNIKIGDVNGTVGVFFSILDITSYQLEGLRYRVTDVENQTASFDCRDFEFFVDD
jgi:hypothetical protein